MDGSCPKLLETGSESCLQTVPAKRMSGVKYLSLASPISTQYLTFTLRSRTAPVSASSSGNGANAGARMLPIRVKTKPSRLSEIHAHVHETAVSSWLTGDPAVAIVIRRAG